MKVTARLFAFTVVYVAGVVLTIWAVENAVRPSFGSLLLSWTALWLLGIQIQHDEPPRAQAEDAP